MNASQKGNTIILASASPRRSLLLEQAHIEFEKHPSNAEEISDADTSAERLVQINALLKAEDIAEKYPSRIVLGADTVVSYNGTVFGKPKNLDDAKRMLTILSGKTHQVFTGVALAEKVGEYACGARMIRCADFARSDVSFKPLNDRQIEDYLSKVPVLDKAGAYAAQEFGELIIDKIEGDFDNVMGLPCKLVKKMLDEFMSAHRTGEIR